MREMYRNLDTKMEHGQPDTVPLGHETGLVSSLLRQHGHQRRSTHWEAKDTEVQLMSAKKLITFRESRTTKTSRLTVQPFHRKIEKEQSKKQTVELNRT